MSRKKKKRRKISRKFFFSLYVNKNCLNYEHLWPEARIVADSAHVCKFKMASLLERFGKLLGAQNNLYMCENTSK